MAGVIQIRTEIPGPKSRALLARRSAAVPRGVPTVTPIAVAHAEGAVITDADGNRLIDFGGGIGVVNTGHRHPGVVDAVRAQLDRFAHVCFPVSTYEPYVELAERLIERAPFRFPAKAAFFNAGTEAVENAVKFARLYTKRPAVIAFEGAFHGRTLLSMTLTSRPHPYKAGMGPLAPEIYRAPFPSEYRGPDTETALAELKQMFATQVAAEQVAAIIVEPVQGEGGFLPAPTAFLEGLRAICDEYGICLIADEVQTGFARTGKLFAIEHSGVEPDLITLAKSIAGGLPLSGVLGKAEILDAAHDGAVGGTFVGNPVAQAAALAVLDVIDEEGLNERAVQIGDVIRSRMLSWQERFPAIGDVRGIGAMLAIELVEDRATKQPAPKLVQAVLDAALQRGLLLLKAGVYGNAIRVLCPLVVTDAELDEALAAWEDALAAALT
jgi:4-aminobutyrate aminotransferase / (S)-3-amino-2-methylpropionate transaminase / 5-aminovalerate transaminase